MYCENCGKEIEENSKFCPCCGNSVETVEDVNDTINQEDFKDSTRTDTTAKDFVDSGRNPEHNLVVVRRTKLTVTRFLKQHWKRIVAITAAVFITAAIAFGSVLIVRNNKQTKIIKDLPSQLAGKVYVDITSEGNFSFYLFNEDGSKFDFGCFFGVEGEKNCLYFSNLNSSTCFKKNLFGKSIKLNSSDFKYYESSDGFRLDSDGSLYSASSAAEAYSMLMTNKSEFYDESGKESFELLKKSIENSKYFDEFKEEAYENIAFDLADDVTIYGLSFSELMDDCVKDAEYEGMEESDDKNTYSFTINCKYAPNKRDLPNMYEDGKLIITYSPDENEVRLSGSVYSGLEVYAIMKAYSYY